MSSYLNICDDLLRVIFDKLSLKEISDVCEGINLDVTNYMKDKLLKRLGSILSTSELSALRNFLKSTGGIITGSFIPNVINDLEGITSDIDIYVSYNNQLDRYLQTFKKELNPVRYDVVTDLKDYGDDQEENFKIERNNDCAKEVKREGANIKSIIDIVPISFTAWDDHKCAWTKLQVIVAFDELMIPYIERTFDFTICKNALYIEDNDFKLYIKNLKDIAYKRIVGTADKYKAERIYKYRSKGYKISGDLNFAVIHLRCLLRPGYEIYKFVKKNKCRHIYKDGKFVHDDDEFKYIPISCNDDCYIKQHFCVIQDHVHIVRESHMPYLKSECMTKRVKKYDTDVPGISLSDIILFDI